MAGVSPRTPLALSDFLDGEVNSIGNSSVALLPKQARLGFFGEEKEKKKKKTSWFMSYKEITKKFSSVTGRENCSLLLTTGQI